MGILKYIKTGADLEREQRADSLAWTFDALAGHIIEMPSGSTTRALSFAGDLILSAQMRGEPCAWITTTQSLFFPKDFAENGIDLNALAILQLSQPHDAAFAADKLLKSGGFGCLVLDFDHDPFFPIPLQRRIAMTAKKQRACVLYLIANDARIERARIFSGTDIFARSSCLDTNDSHILEIELVHKSGLFRHQEVKRGTPGLR